MFILLGIDMNHGIQTESQRQNKSNPCLIKNNMSYDKFKLEHSSCAQDIFAALLLNLKECSNLNWWFDISKLGDLNKWKKLFEKFMQSATKYANNFPRHCWIY